MSGDTTLSLGSFQFQGLEVPSQISGLGVSQAIAERRYLGGHREIQAMGPLYNLIEWSGLFFGSDALARMSTLKGLAAAGQPLTLSWHEFNYLIVIRDFAPDEQRQFQIPYRISCEIVSDNSTPISVTSPSNIDDSIDQNLADAQTRSDSIGNLILTAQMNILGGAIAAVDTFADAEASVLSSVLQPLLAVQNIVKTLLAESDAELFEAPGFGGVQVGDDALTMALRLESTLAANLQETELLDINGILGVMAQNVMSANGSPNTMAVAGGNLFAIAAAQYGDAQAWTAIATANGLLDPFLSTPQTLTLPLAPKVSDGILNS